MMDFKSLPPILLGSLLVLSCRNSRPQPPVVEPELATADEATLPIVPEAADDESDDAEPPPSLQYSFRPNMPLKLFCGDGRREIVVVVDGERQVYLFDGDKLKYAEATSIGETSHPYQERYDAATLATHDEGHGVQCLESRARQLAKMCRQVTSHLGGAEIIDFLRLGPDIEMCITDSHESQ